MSSPSKHIYFIKVGLDMYIVGIWNESADMKDYNDNRDVLLNCQYTPTVY